MLIRVELTNFGPHENLVIDFTEGMNVLRGANEAGKSTAYVGVGYAFWGARALPLSLDETVTWGKGAASLSSLVSFMVEGITYTIKRSKSGAELSGGNGVSVNGQDAVTNYMVGLLKADMKTAQNVMVVGQDGIRDALAGGAGSLIETLSRMSLIDDLISSVTTHLPSGNTKQQELQLLELTAATAEEPVFSAEWETTEVQATQEAWVAAADAAEAARLRFGVLAGEARTAQNTLAAAAATQAARKARDSHRQALLGQIAAFVQPEGADADALLEKAEAQELARAVGSQYNNWCKIPDHPPFSQSKEEFDTLWTYTNSQHDKLSKQVQSLKMAIVTAKSLAITVDSCALCGKLMADVPEVVAVNERVSHEVAALQENLALCEATLYAHEGTIAELRTIQAHETEIQRSVAAVKAEYIQLKPGQFPSSYEWIGPQPTPKDPTDWRAAYNAAKAKQRAGAAEVARQAAVCAQHDQVCIQLEEPDPVYDTEGARLVLVQHQYAQTAMNDTADALTAAASSKHAAERALATVTAQYEAKMAAYVAAVTTRDKLATLVATMQANNVIIKKLREARPIVVRKLWSLVLHLVSDYFSQIRGTISVVTRGEDGFIVDGRPLGAFSGSTKDSLGLAIRIALQKVFLPTVDFMLIDEAAKGMDDNREINMLGALSTCGLTQTVVVTHSPVADTFAANLIEI